MSKEKRFKYGLMGAIGLGLLAGLLTSVSVRSQQGAGEPQTATVLRKGPSNGNEKNVQPSQKELDDAATPIVDFDNQPRSGDDPRDQRGMKNRRYDKYGSVVSEPNPRMGEVISFSHWQVGLSDMPVDKSDLVIEAKVTDSQAFLSDDKTGVYSEFTVRVSRVWKAPMGLTVNKGDMVVTERFGGRVRYPSGKIVRYQMSGQGSPMKGKKYLFFLSGVEQGNYKILTAYELQGDKVFALDGSRSNRWGRGNWAFDKHNGKETKSFLEELERTVNGSQGAN
jgi:hypothetical protein